MQEEDSNSNSDFESIISSNSESNSRSANFSEVASSDEDLNFNLDLGEDFGEEEEGGDKLPVEEEDMPSGKKKPLAVQDQSILLRQSILIQQRALFQGPQLTLGI